MGIFLFLSPTTGLSTYQLMVQQVNARYFCQQGADVRDFACDFLIEVDNLYYSEADVKEVFNICLDLPLSLWEKEKLGNVAFWDFVYHVYHRGEPPPQIKSHSTDCLPFVSGSPSPPMTRKHRRRKNGPAVVPREAADDTAAGPPEAPEEATTPQEAADDADMPPEVADATAAPPEAA